MKTLKKISDDVYIANEDIIQIGIEEINFLKEKVVFSKRKRVRVCSHKCDDSPIHEMLICISSDSYIRPHKHVNKIESFHIIEGMVDVIVFNDEGAIEKILSLGDISTHKKFYYRLPEGKFHTLIIKTEWLVLHEVTNGPFVHGEVVLASWSPSEDQTFQVNNFMSQIRNRISDNFKKI